MGKVPSTTYLYAVSFHSNHYHSYSVVREKRRNVIYLIVSHSYSEQWGNTRYYILLVSMVTPVHLIVLFRKGEEMLHEMLHAMLH